MAVAKTGSGKTLGYLIPGFIHLKRLQNDSKMGPRVLVLSPTRELATQIHDEAEKFGRSSLISSVVCWLYPWLTSVYATTSPLLIDIRNRHSMFYTFLLPISCPILFFLYSSIELI